MRDALCVAISIAAALDVLTTCYVLRLGGREANPLLRRLFQLASPLAVMLMVHGFLVIWLWCAASKLKIPTLVVIAIAWWIVVAWNARNARTLRRTRRAEILISP